MKQLARDSFLFLPYSFSAYVLLSSFTMEVASKIFSAFKTGRLKQVQDVLRNMGLPSDKHELVDFLEEKVFF